MVFVVISEIVKQLLVINKVLKAFSLRILCIMDIASLPVNAWINNQHFSERAYLDSPVSTCNLAMLVSWTLVAIGVNFSLSS